MKPGVEYQFDTTGRNITIKLDAEITSGSVVKECVLGDCSYPIEELVLPDDLDSANWGPSTLYFDIIPNTLDGLWEWSEITHNDLDGDGLSISLENELGTSTSKWDTDGDGPW